MKRPLGVTLISYFYLFGAAVMTFTAIFFVPEANEFGMADRFGLSSFPEQLFRIILAVFSLFMVYGYISLKRWGFWLMMFYSSGFGLVSFYLLSSYPQQPFIGNMIWSIIVILYTLYVRKFFFRIEKSVYN